MPEESTISILPITEEHIEGFHRCLDSVARERLYLSFVKAPPLASAREFVRSNIAQDVPQFVAVHEGVVVGWCDISPMSQEGFTHSGSLGMGVHKGYRRRGVGEQLIRATLEKAIKQGLERIELEVFASNEPAIRLYEKLGFVVEGTKKQARKLDGVYDDIICMALFV